MCRCRLRGGRSRYLRALLCGRVETFWWRFGEEDWADRLQVISGD